MASASVGSIADGSIPDTAEAEVGEGDTVTGIMNDSGMTSKETVTSFVSISSPADEIPATLTLTSMEYGAAGSCPRLTINQSRVELGTIGTWLSERLQRLENDGGRLVNIGRRIPGLVVVVLFAPPPTRLADSAGPAINDIGMVTEGG